MHAMPGAAADVLGKVHLERLTALDQPGEPRPMIGIAGFLGVISRKSSGDPMHGRIRGAGGHDMPRRITPQEHTGTVVGVYPEAGAPDAKVLVRMTGTFSYLIGHVIPDAGIAYGKAVSAGQRIGRTNGLGGANAVDVGVINEAITLTGFSNPKRYLWQQLHCDSPYKYFAEPLRSQLYARVKRSGSDKDGRIDYDITGRLIGNWFHESVGAVSSDGPSVWPYQLAFVPDSNVPTEQRISISSYLPLPGKWKPQDGAPDFASVGVASGVVAYTLDYWAHGERAGVMLVQLTDATHLRVEVFPGSQVTPGAFTAAAKTYIR